MISKLKQLHCENSFGINLNYLFYKEVTLPYGIKVIAL